MSIGPIARRWFLSKYGKSRNKVYSSKYYLPEESWPKKRVWWVVIPSHAIDGSKYSHVNILCQKSPSQNDFYFLEVPVKYFHEHFGKFHRIDGEIDIYLSADPYSLFKELRGVGRLDFSKFVVT